LGCNAGESRAQTSALSQAANLFPLIATLAKIYHDLDFLQKMQVGVCWQNMRNR
jgi:hypothetical protein